MKILLGLLFFVAALVAFGEGAWKPGFRVRFGAGIDIGDSFFISVPLTRAEAILKGYIQMTPPEVSEGPLYLLSLYCLDGCNFCVLFDDTGFMAGAQVGFEKEYIPEPRYDFITQGFISWSPTINGTTREFWVTYTYFGSKEFYLTSPETRIANRDSSRVLQAGGIWETTVGGGIMYIPENRSQIEKDGVFTKQACIPWMGRHFYYNMTTETECTAETIQTSFLLTDSETVIGNARFIVGKVELPSEAIDVFEHPDVNAVKLIVPNGPECFYKLAEDPGITTIHMYFIDEPWWLTCLFY